MTAGTFLLLAAVALFRWRSRRDESGRWAALTFSALAVVALEPLIAEATNLEPSIWFEKAILGVFIAVPYFLYRFTTSFEGARPFARAALWSTIVVLTASALLPELPGGDRPWWFHVYLGLFLAQSSLLSFLAALLLWRAGQGQPSPGRRRMRMLSMATAGIIVALLVSVAASEADVPLASFLVQLLGLISGICFFVGFAPPPILRLAWRRPEQESLQEAMHGLMSVTTVDQITDVLLPHVAAIVGGAGVELIAESGECIAKGVRSDSPVEGDDPGTTPERGPFEEIALSPPYRALRVWTTPYTPFFGEDETRLLRALGVTADLALQRTLLLATEREARSAFQRANEQLRATNEELAREVVQRKQAEDDLRRQADDLIAAREEAERASRAKSEFLSRMSHELRTPLNAILGFGQLLEMEDLAPDQRESVAHVLRAGRHLLNLIDEVLEIARIEAGRSTISMEAVDVDEVMLEAVEMMTPQARERGIRVDIERGDPLHVLADRQRLKQVALNLLSNAIKYNRAQGRVHVGFERADGRVRIGVSDTGPGIPDDKKDGLFVPFERLGAEGSEIQGTGLGLALSKNLVEAMRGNLSVTTKTGEGSTFTVELLPSEDPMASMGAAEEYASERPYVRAGAKVLYIEDNLSNLRLVEQVLKLHTSAQLLTAMQGRIGLDLARRHHPDIVLLDLHLPDIPGDEVLRSLRKEEETRDLPIVMISADATRGTIRRLFEEGATDYMTKPLDVARFLEVVSEHLAERVGR